ARANDRLGAPFYVLAWPLIFAPILGAFHRTGIGSAWTATGSWLTTSWWRFTGKRRGAPDRLVRTQRRRGSHRAGGGGRWYGWRWRCWRACAASATTGGPCPCRPASPWRSWWRAACFSMRPRT